MHKQVAITLWITGLLLGAMFLFTGQNQIVLTGYASLSTWVVPLVAFGLGLAVYAFGGQVEGE